MTPRDQASTPSSDESNPDEQQRLAAILDAPSYVLAHQDSTFLMEDELRGTRLELEFLKPELTMRRQNVRSTIVVFGGTRIIEPADARERVRRLEAAAAADPDDPINARDLEVARRVLAKAHYYDVAREFAQVVSRASQTAGVVDFAVITGGGPGIMEAANRGAWDVGAKSVGLNITLPHEQAPNSFITPELCFQFRYFAIRKLHFMLRARALVVFPGGFGTLDELFEALTLVQTHKVAPLPIILCGREFWEGVLDLQYLAAEGTIAYRDLELISYAETAQEIWDQIRAFHDLDR